MRARDKASSSDALGSRFKPRSISQQIPPLLCPDAMMLPVILGASLTSDILKDRGFGVTKKSSSKKNIVRKNSGGKRWAESDSSYLTFPFNTKENNWMGTKLEMRRRVKKEYTRRHPGASLMPIKFDE